MAATVAYGADGVLAPVEPVFQTMRPPGSGAGGSTTSRTCKSGAVGAAEQDALWQPGIERGTPRRLPGPFDPSFGLACGEDGDLLIRMVRNGARIVWSEEACVHEPVERARLSLAWLLQRALSGGQEFARKTVAGSYGPTSPLQRALLFARALLQMLVAGVLTVLVWPAGRHRSARWLITASANFGKLSVFWGWRYHEYA